MVFIVDYYLIINNSMLKTRGDIKVSRIALQGPFLKYGDDETTTG